MLNYCADSPARGSLLDVKRANAKTKMPCHVCRVDQSELNRGDYDVERNRRTDDQIEYSLEAVRKGATIVKRQRLSSEYGVSPDDMVNPIRRFVHMNMVRQIGVDVFHQDSLNSCKKILKFFIGGLNKNGGIIVAQNVKDPRMRIAGTPPLRDIMNEGGFASQSGMDVWRLFSVVLLVFRPVLLSVKSMVSAEAEHVVCAAVIS